MSLFDSSLSKYIAIAIVLVICTCVISQHLDEEDHFTLAHTQHAIINTCIGALVGITVGEWSGGIEEWFSS